MNPTEQQKFIKEQKESPSQLKEEQLKNFDTMKTQLDNYSMHGKYELKPDEERAPRVEFKEDDEVEDQGNTSIQYIDDGNIVELNHDNDNDHHHQIQLDNLNDKQYDN